MSWRAAILSGSVLILAVAVFRQIAAKHLPRRLFPALWRLAALRLLVPVEIPTRLSLWNLFTAPAPPSRLNTMPLAAAPAPSGAIAVQALSAAPKTAVFVSKKPDILVILWCLGTLLLGLWLLLGYVRALRRFSRGRLMEIPEFSEEFHHFHSIFSPFSRNIRVILLDDRRAPLTYGIFRPVILLPPELAAASPRRTHILTHELMHIRRFDCLRKLLLALCLCLHWWNPLVWLMLRLARRDMELACDEAVLHRLGGQERRAYALTLLDLAEQQAREVPLCSAFGRSAAEERIKAILNMKRISVFITILALLVSATLVTVLATQAAPSKGPQEAGGLTVVEEETAAAGSDVAGAAQENAGANAAADFDAAGAQTGAGTASEGRSEATGANTAADFDAAGAAQVEAGANAAADFDAAGANTGVGTASEGGNEAAGVLTYSDTGAPLLSTQVRLGSGAENGAAWLAIELPGYELAVNGTTDEAGADLTLLRGKEADAPGGYYLQAALPCRWVLRFSDRTLVFEDGVLVSDGSPDVEPSANTTTSNAQKPDFEANPEKSAVFYAFPLEDASAAILQQAGELVHPVIGSSSMHYGVDLEAADGSRVLAAADGTVCAAGYDVACGNYVCISHADGRMTTYQHLSELLVAEGEAVTQGQVIGLSGSSGWATGPHLHFGISEGNVWLEPLALLG